MDGIERRIGARSFARLLGDWRPPGRPRPGRRARRPGPAAGARRPARRCRPGCPPSASWRPRSASAGPRSPPPTRRCADAQHAAQPARRGQLDPAAAGLAGAGRARRSSRCSGRRPLLDLAHAALARAFGGAARRPPPRPLVDLDAYLCGHGYDLLGLPVLRAAIADRFTARGLPTRPDQVLVTAGAQHAIALALAALAGPGDRVLVEHPTYPNVLRRRGHPAAPGRFRCRWAPAAGRGLGPGPAHRRGARRRAAAGLPDPRLPEPDRRLARRGRARAAGRAGPPHRHPAADRRDAGRAGPGRPGAAPARRRTAPSTRRWCSPSARPARCSGAGCGWAGSGPRRRWSAGSPRPGRRLDLGGPVLDQLVAAQAARRPRRGRARPAGRAGRGPRPPARPARRRSSRLAAVAPDAAG